MDDLERIYGGAAPDLIDALRALVDLSPAEVMAEVSETDDRLRGAFDSQIGPVLCFDAPADADDQPGPARIVGVDFEELGRAGRLLLQIEPERAAQACKRAARAYGQETPWDHAPGLAAVWLLYVVPFSACAAEDDEALTLCGTVAGFVIVGDRHQRGEPDVLGHAWTAVGARRKGVGSALVATALAHYPMLAAFQGPPTDAGRALLGEAWPEALHDTG